MSEDISKIFAFDSGALELDFEDPTSMCTSSDVRDLESSLLVGSISSLTLTAFIATERVSVDLATERVLSARLFF